MVEHGLGEVLAGDPGFRLRSDPDTVRAPDLAFIARAHFDRVGRIQAYWPGPPDLANEVVSPRDRWTEVEQKTLQWLDCGARAVVLLDPPRRTAITVRSHEDRREALGEDLIDLDDVVPGWRPAVGDLLG